MKDLANLNPFFIDISYFKSDHLDSVQVFVCILHRWFVFSCCSQD